VRRFERPDGKNRWDSRLFELHPGKGWSSATTLHRSILNIYMIMSCEER